MARFHLAFMAQMLAACLITAPLGDARGQTPAFWNQMKDNCRKSGGRPSSEFYNDWVRLNGCICPASSTATMGSGQPTCGASGSTTPSLSPGMPGGGLTAQQQFHLLGAQMFLEGFILQNPQRGAE